MVTFRKFTAFIVLSLCVLFVNAQDVKVVSSGQGATENEATKIALRSALEDAFGTFISSSTKIENDILVSDEIVSLTQGNIKEYNVLNSSQLENGMYSVLVESIVSLNKLSSYCESKGMSVNFNGKALGMDLKMKEFNRLNERKILKNLCLQILSMNPKIFDFELKIYDAKKEGNNNIAVPILIIPKINSNYEQIQKYIDSTLKYISLTEKEQREYEKLGLKYDKSGLNYGGKDKYYLRDWKHRELFSNFWKLFKKVCVNNWEIIDGVSNTPIIVKNIFAVYAYAPTNFPNEKIEGRIYNKRSPYYPEMNVNSKYNSLTMFDIKWYIFHYTQDEIVKLNTINIIPFNDERYEQTLKPELLEIISQFDNIE